MTENSIQQQHSPHYKDTIKNSFNTNTIEGLKLKISSQTKL